MKFSDKLPKLRKSNNYSQEQLAEKLNVSRQAVSKWEMGVSYPDMEKLLQLCKVLNCQLADLLDDGVVGESPAVGRTNSIKLSSYLKDFLAFITKSYNMFCCLKFREKIKLVLEMTTICLVLLLVVALINNFCQFFLRQILGSLSQNDFVWALVRLVTWAITLAACLISAIIVLHLFKIRYLDYYVTIEDQAARVKQIETPILEKKSGAILEKPKEKIVIRDTKHSAWRFFDFLGKLILLIVKGLTTLIIVLPTTISFVLGVIVAAGCLYHLQYSWLFFWLACFFAGGVLFGYVVLEWAYNFIFNQKQHPRKLFLLIVVSLISASAGLGLSICALLQAAPTTTAADYQSKTTLSETITVDDHTLFHCDSENVECQIDESAVGIVVKMETLSFVTPALIKLNYDGYQEYLVTIGSGNFFDFYHLFLTDLKQGQIKNYDFGFLKVEAHLSSATAARLRANQQRLDAAQEIERKTNTTDN